MTQIKIITSPDDVYDNCVRLLCVDLNKEQTEFISNTLKKIENDCAVYIWTTDDDAEWLFDKVFKSDVIILNCESEHQDIVGWIMGFKKTKYLGNPKKLKIINKNAIYSEQDILQSLGEINI
jgi:hypothetical protein